MHQLAKSTLVIVMFFVQVCWAEDSQKDIEKLIEGHQLVVKNETDLQKKAKIYLNLGNLYYQLGKTQGKQGAIAFSQSLRSAERALAIAGLGRSDLILGNHIMGLVYIETKDVGKARTIFEKVVKEYPEAEISPSSSIYIAESLFEEKKYSKALQYYRMFYDRLPHEQGNLALYKAAWCEINLEQFQAAERDLLSLVRDGRAGEFSRDALKDLAYVSSQFRSEKEVLAFAGLEFSDSLVTRKDFLLRVLELKQRQKLNQNFDLLFFEVLKMETRQDQQVEMLLRRLRTQMKTPLGELAYKYYEPVMTLYSGISNPADGIQRDVQIETENLMKAYALAFTKKAKQPAREVVLTRLQIIVDFYSRHFSKNSDLVTSLKIQLAWEATNYSLVNSLVKGLDFQLKGRAQWELLRLRSLDEIKKSDPQFGSEYVEGLKQFYIDRKNDSQWKVVTQELAAIKLGEKKYEEALPIFRDLLQRDASLVNQLALASIYYELNDYETVANLAYVHLKKSPEEMKLKELIREASLKVAQESSGNTQKYEKYIRQFLSLKPDENKAQVARRALANEYLLNGRFEQAVSLLGVPRMQVEKEIEFEIWIATLGMNGQLSPKQRALLRFAGAEVKTYIGGLLDLFESTRRSHPQEVTVPLIKVLRSFRFTTSSKYSKTFEADVLNKMNQVREYRKQVVGALQDRPIETQLKILKAGSDLELKMSDMIMTGPRPIALKGDNIQKYNLGLVKLSLEFRDQAREYQKIQKGLVLQEQAKRDQENKVEIFRRNWKALQLPPGGLGKAIGSLVRSRRHLAAMILLDLQYTRARISKETYYKARARILLSHEMSASMSFFVYQEMKAQNVLNLVGE